LERRRLACAFLISSDENSKHRTTSTTIHR
jgi:hypothetical protein